MEFKDQQLASSAIVLEKNQLSNKLLHFQKNSKQVYLVHHYFSFSLNFP